MDVNKLISCTKVILLLFSLLLLVACGSNGNDGYCESVELLEGIAGNSPPHVPPTTITSQQAEEMILRGGVIILDVRTPEEFESERIENALLLPYRQITELAPTLIPDKNQTVLVYCQAGRRSRIAADALADLGYTSVYDFGGLQDWHGATIGRNSEIAIEAVATQTKIEINASDTFLLNGFFVNGREYFLINDIAYMLTNTRAQFHFEHNSTWSTGIRIIRGASYTKTDFVADESALGASSLTAIGASMGADFLTSYMQSYTTEAGIHFSLQDIAGFLGIAITHETCGTISIDTNEPNIDEYALNIVKEFLSKRLTLFTSGWSDDVLAATTGICLTDIDRGWAQAYLYPVRFWLYDFSDSGIPDILLAYDNEPWAMLRRYVLYVYESGGYVRADTVSMWSDFYRDYQGNIFLFQGGHHDGWGSASLLSFDVHGVQREYITRPPWDLRRELCEDECMIAIEEEFFAFWAQWDFFQPTSPLDPTESVISIRPLTALQSEIASELTQRFFNE